MKKKWSNCFKQIFSMVLLFGLISTIGAQPSTTTVNWHWLSDESCDNTNSGITSGVVDANIDIIGHNSLFGIVSVKALTSDILVTVTNGDATITGSANRCDGGPTYPARVFFYAAEDCNITFQLANSLDFYGTSSGSRLLDFLVTVSGPGTFNFLMENGSNLNFNPRTEESGGVSFFLAYGSFSGI